MVRRISLIAVLMLAATSQAYMSNCRFNFGVDWWKYVHKNCADYRPNCTAAQLAIPAGVDFIGNFIGSTWVGNPAVQVAPAWSDNKEGEMLRDAVKLKATPVFYTYIIADGAKLTLKLEDCNSDKPKPNGDLCTKGAKYIRDNKQSILDQYADYASNAAAVWEGEGPIIWALEPDYAQYTSGSQQNALSRAEAKQFIIDIIGVIKANMPNAVVSMDISPWLDQSSWIADVVPVEKLGYMNTSGGVSSPNGNIKDITSWSQVWGITKKGMIADNGYGKYGDPTTPDDGWKNSSNLSARINDGVVGVMVALPTNDWANSIMSLRATLPQLKTCVQQYKVIIGSISGGKIVTDPVATAFDVGATVKVTAVPDQGYTFSNWTGAKTSKVNPEQLTMSADQTIGAVFTKTIAVLPRKSALPLHIQQTLGGISLRIPVTQGTVQVEVVGMDGNTESVLQKSSVQTGFFEASYALAGLRTGLHVVRVVNGDREFRSTMTVVR